MISPARRAAYETVLRVFEQDAYADRALRTAAEDLDRRDRALAQRLAYGTIQRVRTLDFAIESLGRRPVRKQHHGRVRVERAHHGGDAEGDFNVTLTMITDTCNAPANYLLKKPSTAPHPTGAVGGSAVLPVGSANYNAIAAWISGGC